MRLTVNPSPEDREIEVRLEAKGGKAVYLRLYENGRAVEHGYIGALLVRDDKLVFQPSTGVNRELVLVEDDDTSTITIV